MKAASPEFFREAMDQLRSLSADAEPLWGTMSAQQMVEHLVGSRRISNGNARVQPILEAEEIERRRAFLFSERAYERNLPNPVFKNGAPALRKESLAEAIDQLESELEQFFVYHAVHEDAVEMHPVFGALDYDGWILFQEKHMRHHMQQFGLKA